MTDVRKMFRWVGGAITSASALFTFAFGLALSSNWYTALVVALALACAAIGAAFIWPFVAEALGRRRWLYACFITVFAMLLTGIDVVTNFGSISWQRATHVQAPETKNACSGDTCGTQAENQENLKLWEDRRAELLAKSPWLATITTDDLRDELVRSSQAIREESNRGGCGPKCRRLISKYSDLSQRFVAAQQFTEISKNIATARRKIASARLATAKPDEVAGSVMLQNAALERFFTMRRQSSETTEPAKDQTLNWMIAAFLTFAAAATNYMGWWGIGTGTRFGSRSPPGASLASDAERSTTTRDGKPSMTRLSLAGVATLFLGATTVAVFDQVLGWQGLLFSAPVVFLLGSGAAWWVAEAGRPQSSNAG